MRMHVLGWVLAALGAGLLLATGLLDVPVMAALGLRVTGFLDVPWRAAVMILAGLALVIAGAVILRRR